MLVLPGEPASILTLTSTARSSFSPALRGKCHISNVFFLEVYIRDATWTNSPRRHFFLLSLVNKQNYALTTQQPSFLPPLPLNNLYSNLSNKHTPLNPLNYLSTTPKPLFPPPPGVQKNPTTLKLFAQYKVQQSFPLHPIHLHKTSDVVSYCQYKARKISDLRASECSLV